jgi:NifU-like protein involved in Fe-S cluster formation
MGKTLSEVKSLHRDEIVKAVGGLPQGSTHAAQLAIDALAAAVDQIKIRV